MTLAVVGVWRQREDLLIPRLEALLVAKLERLKELLSEYSQGNSHDEECELVPHAGILSRLTRRGPTVRGRSAFFSLN
jgi:hypothetical protein